MSLNQLLLHNPDYPAPWSDLSINSLRVKQSIVPPPITPLTTENFYVSGSGSDSNTGLTAGSPVLTMKKVISVASEYSASECVINVIGTIAIGDSAAPANSGFDKVLDFTPLTQNYQMITILGERSDELSFAAGVAGTSPANPWDQWYNLTGLSGLVSAAYTKGIVHKKDGATQDQYVCCIANNTTQATVASDNGVAIAAQGFEIYNVGSSVFYENSKYFVQTSIPIIFRDMQITGPSSSSNFMLCLEPIQFYGCKFYSQAASGFLMGEFYCYGCVAEAATNGNTCFRQNAKLDVESFNFQGVYENFTVNGYWEDINSVNSTLTFSSSVLRIDRTLMIINSAVRNDSALVLSDSELTILKGSLTLDSGAQPTVYMVKSQLYTREAFSAAKTTGGTQPVILCEDSCVLKCNGDLNINTVTTHGIILENSNMSITPNTSATPYVNITSTNEYAIDARQNSYVILNQEATKDTYNIISQAKEAVHISDNSLLLVNAAFANGPNFSSPATFAMIKSNYGSKVILGNASYVNAGAGNDTVLNGITATTVAASGAAQDIALVGTANTATAQFCHVIVK